MEIKLLEKGASTEVKQQYGSINKDTITRWIISKKIVKKGSIIKSFEDLSDWTRTGGESYCSTFKILYSNKKEEEHQKVINIKAIISIPVEQCLGNWERRRKILLEKQIPVSHWYFVGKGIIIEDFYPKKVAEVNDLAPLFNIAETLDNLGFRNPKFTRDILCDTEGNPFYVDFGFDLGEPSNIITEIAKDHILKLVKDKFFKTQKNG